MKKIIEFRVWDKREKIMYQHAELTYDNLRNDMYDSSFGSVLENDDYEIMQYSGLKDKNGNKIFDGDIVYLDVSNIYATVQVVFQDGAFGYLYPMTETEFDFMSFCDSEYGIDTQKAVEILGNIYENADIKLCKDMGRRKC